jgi:phenylacetate-coenzyme A ligase PaaK-like adenylate-forming protein
VSGYEALRRRHVADARARVPEFLARADWPAERLAAHRQAALRRIIAAARAHSPWHGRRLAGVDPDTIDEAALAGFPVMTKDDLMGHFDEIVTDKRLTLRMVDSHLEGLTSDAYLLGRYHAVASGGSTGRRGVFVYDWDDWTLCYLATVRPLLRACAAEAAEDGRPPVMVAVSAANASHVTGALFQTFSDAALTVHRLPVTRPRDEIVAGLNTLQPTILGGYPSALYPLTADAAAGRLRIRPRLVVTGSEPLLPEIRAGLTEAWGVPVLNRWGASEGGILAASCHRGGGMHLTEDLVIIEPVDGAGAPVPPGTRSAKVLLTSLTNTTLPLIRYELTDEVVTLDRPCACGSAFGGIDDIHGRLDDTFHFNGVAVHPHVFRSPLGRRRNIVEYQVRQTPLGAVVAVRCGGPVDLETLRDDIAVALEQLGVPAPQIVVRAVDQLERQPTGKLRRFLPLSGGSARPV